MQAPQHSQQIGPGRWPPSRSVPRPWPGCWPPSPSRPPLAEPGPPRCSLRPLRPPAEAVSAPAAAPVASPIRDRIDSAATCGSADEKMHTALLRQFYAAYDFQPVWEGRKLQARRCFARGPGRRPWARSECFMPVCCTSWRPCRRSTATCCCRMRSSAYADALARGAVPIEARYDDEDLTPDPVDVAAALTSAQQPGPGGRDRGTGAAFAGLSGVARRSAILSGAMAPKRRARAVPRLPATARRSGAPSLSIWNGFAGCRVSFRPTAFGSISRPRASNCIATTARSSRPASLSAKPTSRRPS